MEGLAGQFDGSKVRSVAWMLFLDLLPQEKGEWGAALAKSRASYEATLVELVTNPHEEAAASEDLAKNNPLVRRHLTSLLPPMHGQVCNSVARRT